MRRLVPFLRTLGRTVLLLLVVVAGICTNLIMAAISVTIAINLLTPHDEMPTDWPYVKEVLAVSRSESGAAASYIEAVLNQDADNLAYWSCQEAQGQRPQDTTLYKLLEKWAVYWGTYGDVSLGRPPATVRPAGVKFDFYFLSSNKRRSADESSLVLVEVTSPVRPSDGRQALQLEGTGLTLPVIREGNKWRVCDLGRGDLKVTARAIPDPPSSPTPPSSPDTYVTSKDDEFIIQPDGDVLVTETVRYAIRSGELWGGYRGITLDRADGIADLRVSGEGQPYPEVELGSPSRSYRTFSWPDKVLIAWLAPAGTVGRFTVVFQYRLLGGLRIDPSGDQFMWRPLLSDKFNRYDAASATIHLPGPVDPSQLRAATTSHAAAVTYPDRQTVVFSAKSLPAGAEMEISVQFPHGLVSAQPPAWQVREDALRLTPTPK